MVRGDEDVDLGHVEQQSLTVTVANSGSTTAEGKVDTLNVTIWDQAMPNLGRLQLAEWSLPSWEAAR